MHKNRKYGSIKTRFQVFVQLFFLLLSTSVTHAQVIDTIKTTGPKDTVILKTGVVKHSPKKAALYSTLVPGLGQLYNRKYWKLPLLYGGGAGLAYLIISNNNHYHTYRTAYRYRMDGYSDTIDDFSDPKEKNYLNDDALLAYTKGFHRWRDLSLFGAALLYVLNIVDATVDAHLFSFDVSDDLSIKLQPAFINTAAINSSGPVNLTGLSIHLSF